MKKLAAVVFFSILFFCAYSQKIQTIVAKQVVAGNAFQIQYIIDDPSELADIAAPQFDNLHLISGPNYYKGNSFVNGKMQMIENITYTLVPQKEGVIKIDPLSIRFKNGSGEKSDEVTITVIPQPKASFNSLSTYTDINVYAPSLKTDLDKLIAANLFIRAEVSKRICFLGEAITASFKLYSRLQSTSEVINAPSLYGFSVMDMLDINETHQAVETIDGKVFNTSVLRKLQLYPSQTGRLTVDEMQLKNSIEFIDSSTGKKVAIQKLLASTPIEIEVKSLPSKQPVNFSGAVGKFNIVASIQDSEIEDNTQGKLTVIIDGKGNFIQFVPPAINWPKEFDVFDPVITDALDKNASPTEGSRKYVFNFTANRAGNYIIPPISFSFFDVSAGKFKEVHTDSLRIDVVAASTNNNKTNESHLKSVKKDWIYLLMGAILLVTITVVIWKNRKQKQIQPDISARTDYHKKLNDIIDKNPPDKQFCFEIQKMLLDLQNEFSLSGEQKLELQSIGNDCQLLIYSDINTENKRTELQKRAEAFIKQLRF